MDLLRNMPPLRIGGNLLKITATTFDELVELHLTTCARFARRNVDGVSGIFKADGFGDFVDHQRRQYQSLWSDREEFMGSASEIIRRALEQINDLWGDPPGPGAPRHVETIEIEHPPQPEANAGSEANAAREPVFELFIDQNGDHRFRLICEAGTELLTSEGYKSKKSATNGIEVVRRNAGNDSRYDRIETDSGLPMFNLKAGNHQTVATSMPYHSAHEMEDALAMIKSASATARVVDP